MKTVITVLLSLAVLTFTPQLSKAQNVYGGLKVGGSLLTMGGDAITNDVDVGNKAGLAFGAFVEVQLSEVFSIQPEILYVQKGIKKAYSVESYTLGASSTVIDIDEDDGVSYLQIPLLAKFNVPTNTRIQPSIFLGPAVAFHLNANTEGQSGTEILWDGHIANCKTTDFSAIAGAGIGFPVGRTTFFLDARYDYSLSTAFKDLSDSELDNLDSDEFPFIDQNGNGEDLKHRAFSFSMGVMIPLTRR